MRLVKKLPGPMIDGVEPPDGLRRRPDGSAACGSSHSRANLMRRASAPRRPRPRRASAMPSPYSAQIDAGSTLTGHTRPRQPSSAAQPVDRRQEVAAVLLHHRQQQVAAGVPGQAIVLLERRQPREQHAARLAFVAGERERALEHVARRQHARARRAADRSCRRCRTS